MTSGYIYINDACHNFENKHFIKTADKMLNRDKISVFKHFEVKSNPPVDRKMIRTRQMYSTTNI